MNSSADRSAPGVRVTVLPSARAKQGTPVDLAGRIVSFTYEDAEKKADKVTLTLDNFDLSLFDRPELLNGALLEVSWGYPGNMAPPRRVVVNKIKGFTTLTLEGTALSAQMNQQVRTRGWQNKQRSDVVREIAAEYGYEGTSITIDDTPDVFDVINQCAETDAWFLRRLAGKEHFVFLVDDTGFHWHGRKQDKAPVHVFTWFADPDRGEVMSVGIEANLVKQAGSVSVQGRDPVNRSTLNPSANKDTVKRTTLSQTTEVHEPEKGSGWLVATNATASARPTAATTPAQAQREADARFVRNERAAVKLTMQVVGDPSLRAKAVVEVRNISSLLSGKYYLTEVKHTISGSGYLCDLKLTRDGVSTAGAGGAAQRPPQGGDKNTHVPPKAGELTPCERPDVEKGGTVVSYLYGNQKICGGDPESSSVYKPGKGL